MKKWFAILLCVFVINSGLVFPVAANAETDFYDSIEDALGVPIVASSNAWNFANSTMTSYMRASYQSISAPSNVEFSDAGMELSKTNGTDSFRFSAFTGWSPISLKDSTSFRAVYFKVKGTVHTVVKSPDNYSILRLTSQPGTALSTMKTKAGESATREVTYDITPDENWMEYLLVPRNTNAAYVWARSETKTQGKWVKVMGLDRYYYTSNSSEDYQENRKHGIEFSGSGTVAEFRTVDYNTEERKVVATDDEAKPEDATFLWFSEDFETMPDYNPVPSFGNAISFPGNGTAYMPVKYENAEAGVSATSGYVKFDQLEVPLGGYLEFKMKSNGLKKVSIQDGTNLWEATMNCDYSALPGATADGGGYFSDSDSSWRTWRLVRGQDGYDVYSRTENDSGWRIHATGGISGSGSGDQSVLIRFMGNCDGVSDGNAALDYVKVYGPAPEEQLVMTDGNCTTLVVDEVCTDPAELRVLAAGSLETDRMLFLAEYGDGARLRKIDSVEIPKGTGSVSVPCDFSDEKGEVREYKVFLWDGLTGISPAANNLSWKGNLVLWQDDWCFTGNAEGIEDGIVLNTKSGNLSSATWVTPVEDAFDLSWEMTIDAFGDEQKVNVSTGTHQVCMMISQQEISFLTNSGTVSVPWAVENKEHFYRLIHKDGVCHLFVDGYYVTVVEDILDATDSAQISISNKGSELEDASLWFEAMVIDEYSDANIPQSQGFCDTFESAEESIGWRLTESGDDDGTGPAWEMVDGNLQCVRFKTRKTTSVAQKYFTNAVGDDYVFSARMKIPSFGTSGMFNIYLPGRALILEMKQKFFSMRTPNSLRASNNTNALTAYSDMLSLEPDCWFDLRIETYDYCNKARVYVDGVKVMEADLVESTIQNRIFDLRLQADWTDPYAMVIDWIHCAPITYGVEWNGVEDGTVYKEGDSISLSSSVLGTAEEVVKYYIADQVVATGTGTNNEAVLSGLPAGNYELTARCGRKISAPISVSIQEEVLEAETYAPSAQASEISYTVTGDGEVAFANGMHLAQVTHQNGQASFLTDEGVQVCENGLGDFAIITDGPFAEVYRNGQFVLSYYMPMTNEVKTAFDGSVTGTVASSPERREYFSARQVTDNEAFYSITGTPCQHVMDFVAENKDEFHLALQDGYYRTDISGENGKLYAWDGERNNSFGEKIQIGTLTNQPAYYRVETSAGMSRLYQNGRWVATFRGVSAVAKDSFAVNVEAGELEFLSIADNVDLYLLRDDFSGDRETESEADWMTSNGMTIRRDETKEMLYLTSGTENGMAELSPTCGDSELSADVIVNEADGFWFIFNHAVGDSYTKVGYSFLNQAFQVIDVITTGENVDGAYQDTTTETVISSQTGTINLGESTKLSAKVVETMDGKVVTLFVNGEEVLSETTSFYCRGNIGFMVENGNAYLDNVSYRGDAKPVVGLSDNTMQGSYMADMIENFDTGEIYLLNTAGAGFATVDGGKTWTSKVNGVSISNNLYQFYEDTTLASGEQFLKGDVLAVSKNGNGRYNGIMMKDEYGQAIYVQNVRKSSDYGATWSTYTDKDYYFPKLEEGVVGVGATCNALKRGYSGRFYYVNNCGSNEDYGGAQIWYSDDGKNWTMCEEILSKDLGFVIAEAIVIETQKSTRLYFRTDLGTISYFESDDYGETWDLTPHRTPFISIASCFNVEIDPEDPNTVYIAWVYDNSNLYGRHQFPRTRWSVAKSTDGGETFEMLGTVHENNSAYHENSNMNIMVSSDYVFLCADSSRYYRSVSPLSMRIVSFPKEGQKTSKRFEQVHLQYPGHVENAKVMSEELQGQALVLHRGSGAAWFRNQWVEDVVYDKYLSAECAAEFIGASVSQEDGKIILKIGEAKVPFYQSEQAIFDKKPCILLSVFAERLGLTLVEDDGVIIASVNQDWSVRQKKALRYAVDVFGTTP